MRVLDIFSGIGGFSLGLERAGMRTAQFCEIDPRTGWRARMENPSALYGGADGVSFGMERNKAIGNAVVPQVIQKIGEAIMRHVNAEGT